MRKYLNKSDVFLLLALLAMFGLYAFAKHRNNTREISKIEVRFLGKGPEFLTQKSVDNLLKQNFPKQSRVLKENLDLNNLERELQKHQMIETAQVYIGLNGTLYADVVQKTAIARVLKNRKGSHYLDSQGNVMRLSANYSAHLPVVYGDVSLMNKTLFTAFLNTIQNDSFLKVSVTGIRVAGNQELFLQTRDGDFDVEFGTLEKYKRKFTNYKAFIQTVKNDTILKYYKKINLRFTKQVVCTK